jgi:hypothetical protein
MGTRQAAGTLRGMHYVGEPQQDQQAAPLSTEQQLHNAHRNEHGNTLEGTAPAGSQRHATIHQHTQNNDADTSGAPGDESAGVGPSSVPTASNTVTAVKVCELASVSLFPYVCVMQCVWLVLVLDLIHVKVS